MFVYRATEGGDWITGFVSGEDTIEIQVAGFGGGLVTVMLQAGQFTTNLTRRSDAAAGVGQFIYEADAGRLWWDADGVGGQGASC